MMFNNIIIWGDKLFKSTIPLKLSDEKNHELHNLRSTFSYVYYGYYRAFKLLQYNVYWIDHTDNYDNINLDNSLIISYNQPIHLNVDSFPINIKSYYLLHNCYWENFYKTRFQTIPIKNIVHLFLPVDTTLNKYSDINYLFKNNEYDYGQFINNFGYVQMSLWATDLLPHEINEINEDILNNINSNINTISNDIYFVGTLDHNDHMKNIIERIKRLNINFYYFGGVNRNGGNISIIDNINYVKQSKLSLCLQPQIQIDYNYCSCRVFKSISYGKMPLSNNSVVKKIFGNHICFSDNYDELIQNGIDFENNMNKNEILKNLIINVRDNHTFVSRINSIIKFFNIIDVQDNVILQPHIF